MEVIIVVILILSVYAFVKVREHEKHIRALQMELFHLRSQHALPDWQSGHTTGPMASHAQMQGSQPPPQPQMRPPMQPPIPSTNIELPLQSKRAAKASFNMENWVGRNVLGIAAAILVFTGLIFFGILTFQYIDETGKMIVMFLMSGIITATGLVLERKHPNVFTQILTGTGFGCIFISVLLSHVWLEKIGDVMAFGILLLWMIVSLLVSKKMDSLVLSIVTHLGMVISITLAFEMGMQEDKILIVVLYQLLSVVVIVAGNLLCFRKTYQLGLFLSLLMMLWGTIRLADVIAADPPAISGLFIAFFAIEFIGASVLSCLLELSTTRLSESKWFRFLHVGNKLLWLLAAYLLVDNLLGKNPEFPFWAAYAASMFLLLLHGMGTTWLTPRLKLNRAMESITVPLLSVTAGILLFSFYFENNTYSGGLHFIPVLPMLFLLSGVLYAGFLYSRQSIYKQTADVSLLADAGFMCIAGYAIIGKEGTLATSILYMLGILGILGVKIWRKKRTDAGGNIRALKLMGYLFTEISLLVIVGTLASPNRWLFLLILLNALNLALFATRFDNFKSLFRLMKINEALLMAASLPLIAFSEVDAFGHGLKLVLLVLLIGVILIRIKENSHADASLFDQVWTGLKITLLVLATIQGNSDVLEYAYVFSIICMLTALASIGIGLVTKAKFLRLYGLGVTLLFVLKMVTYDVSELNTLLRVIVFISGGLICFLISAFYNRLTKAEAVQGSNEISPR